MELKLQMPVRDEQVCLREADTYLSALVYLGVNIDCTLVYLQDALCQG